MSDAPAFEILGVTIYHEPRRLGRALEVAGFFIRYGCLDLHGVSLLLRDCGSYTVRLPKAGRDCRVYVAHYGERQNLLDAALAAYRAIAELPVASAPV